MNLDPRLLSILAAIVDHGGLTEGAKALGKSQPSVSLSLEMLEDFLNNKRPWFYTLLPVACSRGTGSARGAQFCHVDLAVKGGKSDMRIAGTPFLWTV